MKKIIINARVYGWKDILLPEGSKDYRLELFCRLIYNGYKYIKIDGMEATPEQVKRTIRDEV